MKSHRFVPVLLGMGAVLASAAAGWLFSHSQPAEPDVMLEFDTTPYGRGVLQGENAAVPLLVHNLRSEPVTIEAIHKSCVCISVVDDEGRSLKLPYNLGGGESLTGKVIISTDSRQGVVAEPLKVEYNRAGSRRLVGSELRLHVCPGPHSLSGPIVLTSDALTSVTTIGDAFPGEGVVFEKVRFDPRLIASASLEPVSAEAASEVAEQLQSSPCRILARYRLHVAGIDVDREYRGYVELIPSDPKRDPLLVPVHFHSRRHNTEWKVFPMEVLIRRSESPPLQRKVYVLPPPLRRADVRRLSVWSSNPSLSAVGRTTGSLYEITVTMSDVEALRSGAELVIRCGSEERVSSVPIRMASP